MFLWRAAAATKGSPLHKDEAQQPRTGPLGGLRSTKARPKRVATLPTRNTAPVVVLRPRGYRSDTVALEGGSGSELGFLSRAFVNASEIDLDDDHDDGNNNDLESRNRVMEVAQRHAAGRHHAQSEPLHMRPELDM